MKYLLLILFTFSIYANRVAQVERSNEKIKLDGKLDEEVWKRAEPTGNFTQINPIQFDPASDSTQIRFAYDDDNFYVGIKVYKVGEILSTVSRRDNLQNSERIIVSLDTYFNKRNAVSFAVTADGVRGEYSHQSDSEYDRDHNFNPVWEAKSIRTDFGWQSEVRIPLSQLRFKDTVEQTWGLNMNHWSPNHREDNYWRLIPKDENGWASRFGELRGFKNIKQLPRVELLPYASNVLNVDPASEETYNNTIRFGGDAKIGLGPNSTLDLTFFPDFGQVEADPAEVNLTGFETFFEEQRPFFTEGRQLFAGGGRNFFYSRRIGSRPASINRLQLSGTALPQQSEIYGAAKLIGRTDNGYQYGALSAVSEKNQGFFISQQTGQQNFYILEPTTAYNVFTGLKEFNDKQSGLSFILTNTNRLFEPEDGLDSILHRNATAGSIALNHRFDDLTYEFDTHLGFSHVNGTEKAILESQTSFQRYFQMPGLDHLSIDSNATSMTGYTGRLRIDKKRGNFLWGTGVSFDSPTFEINDAGFMNSTDRIDFAINFNWRQLIPKEYVRNYNFYGRYYVRWDFGGNRTSSNYDFWFNMDFLNNNGISLNYNFENWRYDNRASRGGPMVLRSPLWQLRASYDSDFSKNFAFSIDADYGEEFLGHNYGIGMNFVGRFLGSLELRIRPQYRNRLDPWQILANFEAAHNRTYGRRWVFGRRNQEELSAQIRLNYALTPDLSLEFYGEPFISRVSFDRISEIGGDFSSRHIVYGEEENTSITKTVNGYLINDNGEIFEIADPDRYIISFRSNMVLRWEYIPGSIFFLVWQQNVRDGLDPTNQFNPGDIGNVYSTNGINTLAIKFSYWFNSGKLISEMF